MDINSETNTEQWVENRMDSLGGPPEWEPEVDPGLARLRRVREAQGMHVRAKVWTVGVVFATALGALLFPSTRVFAGKCVDACTAGTSEIGTLLHSVFSSSPVAGTSVEKVSGEVAPDFTAVDSSGAELRLSAMKGKVVVLNFWATWCAPCARETPLFVELQRKYGAEGLEMVGISLDDDGWAAVRPFMERMGVNYRMVLGDERITKLYGDPEALPVTVIIDRTGRVTSVRAGLIGGDFETAVKTAIR